MKKGYDKTRRLIWDGVFLFAGSFCFGLSVSVFTAPANIAPGGATGAAILLQYLFGLPTGIGTILLNLPLLFLAFTRVGRGYFWRTLAGLTVSSVVIDLAAAVIPPFGGERLLAALFGGVLSGAGVGLLYVRGASTGGTEIVAVLLRSRFPQLSVGNLLLMADAAVIIVSAFVFGQLESALYAAITVFLTTQVMDRLVYGGKSAKFAVIVSEKAEEIAAAVLCDLARGVTKLQASGGYTGEPRAALLCAVSRGEIHRLRGVVKALDPAAFVIFATADEVFGNGFSEKRA